MDDIPLREFVLVSPTKGTVCQKIVGKQFVAGQITVEECQLRLKGKTMIDAPNTVDVNSTVIGHRSFFPNKLLIKTAAPGVNDR
ncbi:hypothetical protein P879_11780 [Paragonimus westermani]|uniref:Uncharacterized protein n=1 Tax=Paragonimus westermani TaxID=34504 RepID=A0A8T0D6N0_9TREM|nr:hypothetical protein P879_11780 [Paragonimus westermani]